jgi:hypothetical protein
VQAEEMFAFEGGLLHAVLKCWRAKGTVDISRHSNGSAAVPYYSNPSFQRQCSCATLQCTCATLQEPVIPTAVQLCHITVQLCHITVTRQITTEIYFQYLLFILQ